MHLITALENGIGFLIKFWCSCLRPGRPHADKSGFLLPWSKALAHLTTSDAPHSLLHLLVGCHLLYYELLVFCVPYLSHWSPEECKGCLYLTFPPEYPTLNSESIPLTNLLLRTGGSLSQLPDCCPCGDTYFSSLPVSQMRTLGKYTFLHCLTLMSKSLYSLSSSSVWIHFPCSPHLTLHEKLWF